MVLMNEQGDFVNHGQNPCKHGPGILRDWQWWGSSPRLVAKDKLRELAGHLEGLHHLSTLVPTSF